jgi:hypothetical protein
VRQKTSKPRMVSKANQEEWEAVLGMGIKSRGRCSAQKNWVMVVDHPRGPNEESAASVKVPRAESLGKPTGKKAAPKISRNTASDSSSGSTRKRKMSSSSENSSRKRKSITSIVIKRKSQTITVRLLRWQLCCWIPGGKKIRTWLLASIQTSSIQAILCRARDYPHHPVP